MSEKKARFRFHGSLNDFLSPTRKNGWIEYMYNDRPALKDAIEALGVPHVEVEVILVNEEPAGFLQPLLPMARVEVYPLHYRSNWPADHTLSPPVPQPPKFILDVHLGKLAKSLRMLGFDSLYETDYADATIARLAEQENRPVLTRDIGLLKHKAISWGYWLRSQHPDEQLLETIRYFDLKPHFQPLSRCLACNGILVATPKETVLEKLPPKTMLYFHEFYQCQTCRRVYWKGSHYDRMRTIIHKIEQGN
ncbi:Mut7-C RNAse domain-containing protein [Telluribacter sp.]|jgi:hypothetical protein|uniref:Mut7-C RNAse domain-containing protein n=1 Tax=Telluribacter sp. TaxID=1978767 RepID=UPI002E0DEF17|nr:Mut7-C RNAse domain-containing protein [Telluribacter sp.]